MHRGPLIALLFSVTICAGIIFASYRKSGQKPAPTEQQAASPKQASFDNESFPDEKSGGDEEISNASGRPNHAALNSPPIQEKGPIEHSPDDGHPLVAEAPAEIPKGMVWIPGGEFQMGGQDDLANSKPDELPVHSVALDGFYMDATEVTNAEFSRFVAATGYKTYAELHHSREEYKGQVPDISAIPEENLKPASICFNPAFDTSEIDTSDPLWPYHVWKLVQGADWRHPHGPDSNIEGKLDHPVVHVNYQDVMEYCKWAGKRLPTEAEWEYAARGGKEGLSYSWGNERNPDGPGKWRINIWQGTFPIERKIEDGYKHSAPAISDQFPPNDYGLYHMLGNVWEWTSDYYRPDYYAHSPKRNPRGPSESFDPQEPQFVKRVQRGGSFMCNENYCLGYRVSSRMKGDEISGSFHCGFRCVVGWNELEKYQNAPRQKQK